MSDLGIMKYIQADKVYIYPSTNATDGGEINSEQNLSSITTKLSRKNFVVKSNLFSEPLKLTKLDNTTIQIESGDCCVEGRYIRITEHQTLSFADVSVGKYHVIVYIRKDQVNNVFGDSLTSPSDNTLICRGCAVGAVLEDQGGSISFDQEYVDLGTLTVVAADEGTVISGDIVDNPNKYVFIDIDQIGDISNNYSFGDWIVNNAENLLPFSESGSFTPVTQTTRSTNVYNGTTPVIARADHSHDGRYVDTVTTSGQTIKGGFNCKSSFSIYKSDEITSSPYDYVLRINQSTPTNWTTTIGNPNNVNNVLQYGDTRIEGTLTATKVYGAYWNDLAEWYLKSNINEFPESGTIISKEIGTDRYTLTRKRLSKTIVGICSSTYGFILGGDNPENPEDNRKKYIPVALAGRVRVLLSSKGMSQSIKEGDYLKYDITSNGRACKATKFDLIFNRHLIVGKALESRTSNDKSVRKVLVQIVSA